MSAILPKSTYSARARLIALFVVFAFILGGGGSPNPSTELLLELIFVATAIIWLWLPDHAKGQQAAGTDHLLVMLAIIPLVIPLAQLVPLPPAIWTHLPGRENEIAALALVGEETTWRALSMSPSRTLASLLSIVPAVFCLYAVGRLDLHDRRVVLAAIVVMGIVTGLLGTVQLTAGEKGLNLYSQFHAGWVTGFQANRNATADVLLISFLAFAVLIAPYLSPGRQKLPLGLDRRALAFLVGAVAVFLLAATVMTGSRTGIILILPALAAALVIVWLARQSSGQPSISPALLLTVAVLIAAFAIYFVVFSENSAIGRVMARFLADEDNRTRVWQDSWFALKQYWPFGFGMGGFVPAILPAERLEFLDASLPNRAHNDFLELGIEAGLLGYLLLVATTFICIAMAWRAWRLTPAMRRQVVFGLTVLLLVALHSVVDYPLRSMAVACLAGIAGGMLARNKARPHQSSRSKSVDIIEGQA